jgi:hypothetical protein
VRITFHDHRAQGDLAIAADGHAAFVPYRQDGGRMEPSHEKLLCRY